MTEHYNYRNIDKLEEKMRSYQSLPYALIGGFVLSILGAFIWAVVVVASGYQVGIIAILIGILVGLGVRYFGAGYDPIFGIVGGFYTFLSCVLGGLFGQVGFAMSAEGASLIQTLSFLNLDKIITIIIESFSILDLFFYAIAIFEGIKFSRRGLEPNTDPNDSLEPPFSSMRGPLIGTISISLLFVLGYLSFSESAQSTYFYETGEKMSVGSYSGGYENGEWEYFYTNGQTESKGTYDQGKQAGEWNIYYDAGQLANRSTYSEGLMNGENISFYQNGTKMNVSEYSNGRLNGISETLFDSGSIASKGEYLNDREQNGWTYYYENGNSSAQGRFEKGEYVGVWKYWYENGNLKEILDHKSTEDYKILEAYDFNSRSTVSDGNGTYSFYYEDGTILSSGMIKEGVKIGEWKFYDKKGKLYEEGFFEDGLFRVVNYWSIKGQHVTNGTGNYRVYSDRNGNLIESREIKDGLKSGNWIIYDDSLQIELAEIRYVDGLLNGPTIHYYMDGSPSVKLNYKNDKIDGIGTWFHHNGNKNSEVNHINGLKEGVQKFWNELGVQTKEEEYALGELIGKN